MAKQLLQLLGWIGCKQCEYIELEWIELEYIGLNWKVGLSEQLLLPPAVWLDRLLQMEYIGLEWIQLEYIGLKRIELLGWFSRAAVVASTSCLVGLPASRGALPPLLSLST